MDIWAIFAAQLMARQTAERAGSQFLIERCGGDALPDYFGEIFRGYRLAARLVASFVALALLFAALGAAGLSETRVPKAQPSFTPFSAAMWSESIGR